MLFYGKLTLMSALGDKRQKNDHVTFYMVALVPGRLNIHFGIAHKFKAWIESVFVVLH